MMFRRVKAELLKTVRKMRSVRMCWMSISSTASCESSGLIEVRQISIEIGERFFERGIRFVALLNEFLLVCLRGLGHVL